MHRDYDGARVELPRGGTVLDPSDMPVLAGKAGHDVVTSSGDTLLGADDKAGVAEIMAAIAHLAAHPELPRPTLKVGFTPDEEVGEGATLFDVERFGAACAYTLDGSQPGEIQDETFSGTEVTVVFEGVDIHPGWAKGKLVNAARLAGRLLAELPGDALTPETTAGREGYIHPFEISGDAGRAVVRFIARDFDDALLAEHGALIRRTAEAVAASEPRSRVTVTEKPQYPNMRRFVDAFPQVVDVAERAIRAEGIEVGARADPRRHRRLRAEPEGPADAEPVHGRPRVPLRARVGLRARHGVRRRRDRAARGALGRRARHRSRSPRRPRARAASCPRRSAPSRPR